MSGSWGKSTRAKLQERSFTDEGTGCQIWTGAKNSAGYGLVRETLTGKTVLVHRAAYEIKHGPIPEGYEIDHTCHTPACLADAHLRVATGSQNKQNRAGATRSNKTGVRGVWEHTPGRYRAAVKINGRAKYLGLFSTIEEAGAAASEGRRKFLTHSLMDGGESQCR